MSKRSSGAISMPAKVSASMFVSIASGVRRNSPVSCTDSG